MSVPNSHAFFNSAWYARGISLALAPTVNHKVQGPSTTVTRAVKRYDAMNQNHTFKCAHYVTVIGGNQVRPRRSLRVVHAHSQRQGLLPQPHLLQDPRCFFCEKPYSLLLLRAPTLVRGVLHTPETPAICNASRSKLKSTYPTNVSHATSLFMVRSVALLYLGPKSPFNLYLLELYVAPFLLTLLICH